jgi:hypothetical protein
VRHGAQNEYAARELAILEPVQPVSEIRDLQVSDSDT